MNNQNNNQRTPGQWQHASFGVITNNEDDTIAFLHTDNREADEVRANARLIAAAPELLSLAILCNAYLEPIADQLEICHKQPNEAKALRQLLANARAAIAKATT